MLTVGQLWTYLVILIFSISRLIHAEDRCPPRVNIQPCVCAPNSHPVTVQCTNITNMVVLEEIFYRSDEPFKIFVLDSSNLFYLPSQTILQRNIEQICIQNSNLTSLFDQPPDRSCRMTHLELVDSVLLRGLQWEHLKPMKRLLSLVVNHVAVREVREDFEESVSSTLQNLEFFSTGTKRLSSYAFRKLVNLESLAVTFSKLRALDRTMFPEESKLRLINFSFNDIEFLSYSVFSYMRHLEVVILTNNKLKNVAWMRFSNMTRRNAKIFIFVYGNPIKCDCLIRWLLYKDHPLKVGGHCVYPNSRKGKEISELDLEEFSYCPRGIVY